MLSLKSQWHSLFTSRCVINGIFKPLRNAFKIDQWVFGVALGSSSWSFSWYLASEKLIAFDNSSVILLKIARSTVFDYFCFWNIAFLFLIRRFILSFIQEGCQSSHKIILFEIKSWKIFNMVWLNKGTCSLVFSSKNRSAQSNWSIARLIKSVWAFP